MSTETVLKKALKKISNPNNWVKEHYAVDAHGGVAGCDDTAACAWCAMGAVGAATSNIQLQLRAETLLESITGVGIENFNDSEDTTHDDIVSVFKKAIRRARAQRLKMAAKRSSK